MAEPGGIKPTGPVWPTRPARPVDDERGRGREDKPKRQEQEQKTPPSSDDGAEHVDEYA